MYKIIENYLPEDSFRKIIEYIEYPQRCWYFCDKANPYSKENDYQLMHTMIDFDKSLGKIDECFNFTDTVRDIVNRLITPYSKSKVFPIYRLRMNMFLKTQDHEKGLGYHTDLLHGDDITSMLIYLEDSNGYTEFKETKERIESKRNRALIFNSQIEHQTIMQTNIPIRRNININFKEIQ